MALTTHKMESGLAVTVRLPENQAKVPAIILCHGFCGIQELLLPAFAEAFVNAGFAAVTFDYRGFGASEGERGRLVPALQIEDILAVSRWVQTQPQIDSEHIGLWGTSFGGCHVFGAAAADPAIKCIVSQLAFADGETIVTGKMAADEKQAFIATLDKMAEKKQATGKEMFVAVTRVLSDDESKAFFEENKARYPAMDIKIPFLTVRETLRYQPRDNAARVTCPVLVVVAGNDTVNPPEQGIALYEAVGSAKKALHVEQNAKHYDMYAGPHFAGIIGRQIAWFNEHL
ncbi:TPA: alpha/beta fold hydrolase [Serratia marcescens]|uniref:UilS family quorum-quenching N-acyl-homoserine lactonase n=1 Tax=Serratia TaxID=613 RepID=UPI00097BF111|nr:MULTISPECIES: alpha/beta fold hydrolase [Serratia]MBH1896925.1 alpha/beta fold hydrolase [Serratia marcescens]MBH2691897.1 alpha/beta fold hydrolase [Serratia marcescens]MBH2738467.1 alpha/beta fold hydrolase [Serratia marcescens]MBH2832487.1 alpha/beta fold hydrolase [Serratia marcescens]MBH3221376.1 alpha/beta fold hydrolase [Serratia marcescens]